MVADNKGFLYPQIDPIACTDCGACERVCPIDKNIRLDAPLAAFAAWSKDSAQHLASSSGGAAYVLSATIIKARGVVYGCTSEGIHIRHIRVENLAELTKLQGSKYVQSNVCGLYKQVKTDLKQDRPVLFIGTPCQVAGLKKYIKNVPDKLYLVDLICHGVPSQQMLHEHIIQAVKGKTVERISFRKGNEYGISIIGKDFKYFKKYPYDIYLKAFLYNIICRDSCYHCVFARNRRVSDITIGDFWGLQDTQYLPVESHNGISVLLPITDKGQSLISECKESLVIYERKADEAIKGNSQLRHPTPRTAGNFIFNLLYPAIPFDNAVTLSCIGGDIKDLAKKIVKKAIYGFHK